MRRLLRKVTAIFTVGIYLIGAPFWLATFFVLARVWRRDPLLRVRRLQALTVRGYRMLHDSMRRIGLAHFDPWSPIPGMPDGPCVVVANHPTLMDITAISSALGGGITVVKPQLFRNSLLAPVIPGAGHIEGPGAEPLALSRVLKDAAQGLADGFHVIIFPEGTRSTNGGLMPFGRLAFELACSAKLPLVSLTIRCNPTYLSKEVLVYSPPGQTPRLRLELLAIDDPASVGFDSRKLRRVVEERYHEWWQQKPEGEADSPPPVIS